MKAVISKIDLVNLIGKIQSIVAAKPAIPILSNVLIEAIDGSADRQRNRSDRQHALLRRGQGCRIGAIALPARRFFQLVRNRH